MRLICNYLLSYSSFRFRNHRGFIEAFVEWTGIRHRILFFFFAPFYVFDAPNDREGLQARESSKHLNGQSYRERLAKDTF